MAEENAKVDTGSCDLLELASDVSSSSESHELSKEETLPDIGYDAIILGTGLVESIVSAALSRIGKTVLHLDKHFQYGSEWSTLPVDETSPLGPFQKKWRHFNLDKMPKMVYARGALVELLVQSKVSRYLEFRGVGRTLSYIDGKMVEVPCSAADVFNTTLLSLMEKNVIKRFLTFCLNHDQHATDYQDFVNQPFKDFLARWPVGKKPQLSSFLQRLILHSIAMCSEDVTTVDGLNATQYYLQSIGRFGNTPFLWPMYGSGEFPQAFCRMSAVFGGVYVLNRFLKSLFIEKETSRCCGGTCNRGQKLQCKWLVMNREFCPSSWCHSSQHGESSSSKEEEDRATDQLHVPRVSRGILLTDRSLSPSSEGRIEEPFLLTIPPCKDLNVKSLTHLLELPSSTAACPSGCFVVQLTSQGADAEQDFSGIVDHFFSRQQPAVPQGKPSSVGATTASPGPVADDSRNPGAPASAHDSSADAPNEAPSDSAQQPTDSDSRIVSGAETDAQPAAGNDSDEAKAEQEPQADPDDAPSDSAQQPTDSDSQIVSGAETNAQSAAGNDNDEAKAEQEPQSEPDDAAVSLPPSESEPADDDGKPRIFHRIFFNQDSPKYSPVTSDGQSLNNVFVVDGPSANLSYIAVVKQARQFFDAMFPGEEFLPPAPEPEDICYDRDEADDASKTTGDSSTEQSDPHSSVEQPTQSEDKSDSTANSASQAAPEVLSEQLAQSQGNDPSGNAGSVTTSTETEAPSTSDATASHSEQGTSSSSS